MEAIKILKADVLDILFEDRNKDYGAYNLRMTYNRRITTALLITAGLAACLFIASYVANSFEQKEKAEFVIKDLTLESIPQEKENQKIEPPPPAQPQSQEVQQIKTIRFTNPQIVKDNEVNKDDVPPDVATLTDTKIDVVNIDGTKDLSIATPSVVDDGKNVVEAPKVKDDEDAIITHVEIEAEFPGGLSAWARYLHNNLNNNTPIDNGAPTGTYTVMVQFIVDKQGNISDVKALTSHGYGMEEEAIRAIKRGPKWTPAIQNGRNVNAYRKQPITFIVAE
jgi:periplasmic protein TonB